MLKSLNFFYQRKIQPGFKINKNALVVDIGSGDKPFWRADVYVDRLSLGNIQRDSKFDTIHDLGVFIDGDVAKLPFKDKSFDFSFCSHLLEHVEDPKAAIKEIVRVSKAGYLEIPNGILDTIKPFDSHLWFIYQNKNKLIFVRKGKRLHEILLENGIKYNKVLSKISEPFIRIYWKNKIDVEIIDLNKEKDRFKSKVGNNKKLGKGALNPYLVLTKLIRLFFHTEKNPQGIRLKVLKNNG